MSKILSLSIVLSLLLCGIIHTQVEWSSQYPVPQEWSKFTFNPSIPQGYDQAYIMIEATEGSIYLDDVIVR